ncbi:hypothetical protein niasHT_019988 [Heterodera trifolii]|uniref:Uncharacterized protein n=1 Tax=Heterodera trifolii TaxID=157864 RepID=A0ABD2LIE9_9BILA
MLFPITISVRLVKLFSIFTVSCTNFTVMGAQIETVVISADDNTTKSAGSANANRKHLQEWTRQLVEKVRRTVRAHSERWKLVLIAPGLHTFWRSVAKAAAFCSKILSLWELGKVDDDQRAWDLVRYIW